MCSVPPTGTITPAEDCLRLCVQLNGTKKIRSLALARVLGFEVLDICSIPLLAEMLALSARVLRRQIASPFRAAEDALYTLIAMVMCVREGNCTVETH